MNVFRTIDEDRRPPIVHVGRHLVALCRSFERPSAATNGHDWRDVIDAVRTLVMTLSIGRASLRLASEDCRNTPCVRDSRESAVEVPRAASTRRASRPGMPF
jgi:hypothetical protein